MKMKKLKREQEIMNKSTYYLNELQHIESQSRTSVNFSKKNKGFDPNRSHPSLIKS